MRRFPASLYPCKSYEPSSGPVASKSMYLYLSPLSPALPPSKESRIEQRKRVLFLKGANFLERTGEPSVVPQQLQHLAELQIPGVLYFHEPLDGRVHFGQLLGWKRRC